MRMETMKKPGVLLPALLALAGAFALVNGPSATARAAGKTVVVTMTDVPAAYVPGRLTVKAGTTVLWKNTGKVLHDVTTVASDVQNKSDVALPAGAKPFDSGFMPPGGSWSHTFTVPGHYVYCCLPHEKEHMVGEITVTK
ncbi:MAG: cupredoxin domain-containing protein [Candidatus Binataceae bacterium]